MTDTSLLDAPPTAPEDASENAEPEEEFEDDPETRIARLVLEDFLITQLLSRGRPIQSSEISGLAEGFAPTRAALKNALHDSRRVEFHDREWELSVRARVKNVPREERTRSPLESTLKNFLVEIGKPLPLPVIVREVAPLRGAYAEGVSEVIGTTLKNARWALEVRPSTYLPDTFAFDNGAPTPELILRENAVNKDVDFDFLDTLELELSGDMGNRALQVLEAAASPISRKLLGYVIWKHDAKSFDGRELARALGDRKLFYSFIDGIVAAQSEMANLKNLTDAWMEENGGSAAQVDTGALLRQRLSANQILAPDAEQMKVIANFAANNGGNPFSVGALMTDALEIEADDSRFVPLLQGINDALRRDNAFLAAGIGSFLLRSSVPAHIGEIPATLRPVNLSVLDPATKEALDLEMSDDGLEADAADFVHDPRWEDINEEFEAKLPRRADSADAQIEVIVLNHHFRAGTLKMRRIDEDFFAAQGPLARLNLRAQFDGQIQNVAAWTSRDSGLIYGLGDWYADKIPASGGVLHFARDPKAALNTPIELTLGEPDKTTFISEFRLSELEAMRDTTKYLSLVELLQRILSTGGGFELPELWAEVNVVRRTTKRLMCSVLCAYSCFSWKQRGPKSIVWRFDSGKIDAGFKKNKRKFVRR